MKLLNRSLWRISISSFLILGLWAFVFYYEMIDEIEEGVNKSLNRYKQQIIYQAHRDTLLLKQVNFDQGFYAIQEISKTKALAFKDVYSDTLIKIKDEKEAQLEYEPFRILTTAFEDEGKYYQLKVINSMVEKDDLLERFLRTLVFLYILLIVSIILINNFTLKGLWRPFYQFLEQLKSYRLTQEKSFPQVKTDTTEFKDLQESIYTLLDINKQLFEQQKRFIGNASHELQTPLAISLNKLELLIEDGDFDAEEAQRIAEIIQIVERLIRLNKSLLLLSRIENKQFLSQDKLSMKALVENQIEELSDLASYKNISLEIDLVDDFKVDMNASLAEILIANLLRNALFHNIKAGNIRVQLKNNCLNVENTSNLGQLDSSLIFESFYKSDQNEKNTGLGLSIVKAICDLYKFDIQYYYTDAYHSFSIQFS